MSEWNDDMLRLLQEDVYGRINNDAFFSDVPVLLARKGLVDSDVETALGGLNEKGGKSGVCVIVLMPEVEAPEGETPGPVIEVVMSCQVVTRPLLAEDPVTGNGKDAEQIGLNIVNLLHRFIPYRVGSIMMADKKPLRPLAAAAPGEVQYLAVLRLRSGLDRVAKVLTPSVTPGDSIILATGTPEASLWFTLDGSYPGPANANAHLYTGPFELAPETTFPVEMQVVGYKTGLIPSDAVHCEITQP